MTGYEVCFIAQTSPKGALCVCQNIKINVAGTETDIQHETKVNIPQSNTTTTTTLAGSMTTGQSALLSNSFS